MVLIVETGAGVRGANSYSTGAAVLAYLTARGRETENSFSTIASDAQDEAAIDATAHIENRFALRFKGTKLVAFDELPALGSVAFTGLPTATETVTIGTTTYTFVAALSSPVVANEVLIGADAAATASNLLDAIRASLNAGVTFGTGTVANRDTDAEIAVAGTVALDATAAGVGGNFTTLSGSPTNVTLTAFAGGADGGSQPLSFPRLGLVDPSGRLVLGVPEAIRSATAEYAVRSVSAALWTDSTTAGDVTRVREKVGPIETETEGTGLTRTLLDYPAADQLLQGLLKSLGALIRG